jgi:hypothetical protein
MDRLGWLFNPSGFTPRWQCGVWSEGLGWTHIISDLLIFAAYFTIPIALLVLVLRRRDAPYPVLLALFAAFILCCGATHLVEAIIFYEPIYRFSGVLKALTAGVSLLTAFVLVRAMPAILSAPAILRERESLKESLNVERRRSESLSEEREPMAKRSAELTSRTRRLSDALAAGRVVALRWSVAEGTVLWEIGMGQAAHLCGLSQADSFESWRVLLSPEDADRLREMAMTCEQSRALEFEAPVVGTRALKLRLTATPDPAVAGEARTATGMFRLIQSA